MGAPSRLSTKSSLLVEAEPVDASKVPLAFTEVPQPKPADPLLPQGHATPPPSPAQNATTAPPACGSKKAPWISPLKPPFGVRVHVHRLRPVAPPEDQRE